MVSSTFNSVVNVTHIGTATAIIDIDGVVFLTDPAFDPAGSEYPVTETLTLKNEVGPALTVAQLPHIDAVLLSHEDHPDNLDTNGRALLEGRRVFTTRDGAKNLGPRPGVRGLGDWESRDVKIGHKDFKITATPCQHVPGGECIGFILESESFGIDPKTGLPNAVWFAGDTVVHDELSKIKERWHVVLAILNLGNAHSPFGQITMSGHDGAVLCEELGVDIMTPIHFDGWGHFTEHGRQLREAMARESFNSKVKWLELGKPIRVI